MRAVITAYNVCTEEVILQGERRTVRVPKYLIAQHGYERAVRMCVLDAMQAEIERRKQLTTGPLALEEKR